MLSSKNASVDFTCGFFASSVNFNVSNLPSGNGEHCKAFAKLSDFIERGYPTRPTTYLIEEIRKQLPDFDFETLNQNNRLPINNRPPNWDITVKGNDKDNHFPALKFINEMFDEHLGDLSFVKKLLVPECQFKDILSRDPKEFGGSSNWAVDFFLPELDLVVEIDGAQHETNQDQKILDGIRTKILAKHGVRTHRIPTSKIYSENEIKGYFNALRKELQNNEEISNFRELKTKEAINQKNIIFDLIAIARLQRVLCYFLENKVFIGKSIKLELMSDFLPSFDWAEAAIGDLYNSYSTLKPFLVKKNEFPNIQVSIVSKFSKDPEVLKLRQTLFDFCDDTDLEPDIIYSFSSRKNYRYLECSRKGQVEKVIAVNETENIKNDNFKIPSRDLKSKLQEYNKNTFGISSFRNGQFEIIQSALSAPATLGLIPTGGGKSLTFQCIGSLVAGCSIIVCPITALIRDHVLELNQFGFSDRADFISAEMSQAQKLHTLNKIEKGKLKYLFVSPERFQTVEFRDKLAGLHQRSLVNRVVIDEVHCVSEWGHDFRTSYLNLAYTIRKVLPDIPILCLTATAALKVLEDIQIEFRIENDSTLYFMQDSREELNFRVHNTSNKLADLTNILEQKFKNGELSNQAPFVVFSPTNKDVLFRGKHKPGVPKISKTLRSIDPELKIGVFSGEKPNNWELGEELIHLGVTKSSNDNYETYKTKVQQLFKKNKIAGIVATKAFGMGVNKPNIRLAAHMGMPQSIEALYQEAGRAGRDKKPAECITFFTPENKIPGDLHDANTTIERINHIQKTLQETGGDLSQQLYFLTSSAKTIERETNECTDLLTYFRTKIKNEMSGDAFWINISENEEISSEAEVDQSQNKQNQRKKEKIIYRLKQLGFVEDWTVKFSQSAASTRYTVNWRDQDVNLLAQSIEATITKYLNSEDEVKTIKTAIEQIIKSQAHDKERILIKYLLQWNYDHFVYQRRQSLKNLYEACIGYKDSASFKSQLENYFKVDKSFSTFETLITSNAADAISVVRNLILTNSGTLRGRARLDTISSVLLRYLESYQSNPGLNLLSSLLRLEKDDFYDADGADRFNSFIEQLNIDDKISEILELVIAFKIDQQELIIKKILEKKLRPQTIEAIFNETGNISAEALVLENLNARIEALL